MSSYGAFLPSAARTILSPCRVPCLREKAIAPFAVNAHQVRGAKSKSKGAPQRKKGSAHFAQNDLRDAMQFTLCDAMRYIRAIEVGQVPQNVKYELHIRLKTLKNGPVIRNMMSFPHAFKTDTRICVICNPESKQAEEARAAGASLVGEQEVFDMVKEGNIPFDRCLAHPSSMQALSQSGVARILGPKGLMPNTKTGTVIDDVASRVGMLRSGLLYREKDAVIRLPIGHMAFSPEQVRDNMRTVLAQIKKDTAELSDRINKEVYEVVLSSTHGPGFSLNGEFKSEESVASESLAGL
ncbi:hypothetical protein PHISP_01450 [Aspergillus sp. HF37]|nr:hypothetical protein PHISP_01450 [Aspergillus sp. HF37]